MFEEEKFSVSSSKETKVEQMPQPSLAEIMHILLTVFRQTDFRKDDVQARHEVHGLEQFQLV